MRRIAISDIHGCYKTFQYLIHETIQLTPEDKLYLLGDFIDRGPGSKQVIDMVMLLREEGFQIHCLKGNHEEMMMNARYDLNESRRWMINGGYETMESFSAEKLGDVHEKYWTFLESLYTYFELDDYILVHAGLNFKVAHPLNDKKSCIWIRDWYRDTDKEWLNGKIVVHGHTPMTYPKIKERIEDQDFEDKPFLDIDAGCCYEPMTGLGHLCAFDLDEKTIILQKNLDLLTWN